MWICCKGMSREFPGCPVVGTPRSHCRGLGFDPRGSIPGRGTKIPQAMRCGQKRKGKRRDVSVLAGGPGSGVMANCRLHGMVGGAVVPQLSFPGTQIL